MAESEKVKTKAGKPRVLIVVGVIALITVLAASGYWILSQDSEQENIEQTEEEQLVELISEEVELAQSDAEKAFSMIGLARAEYDKGSYEDAIETISDAIALGIETPTEYQSAILLLAKAQAANGQFEEAINELEQLRDSGQVVDTQDKFMEKLINGMITVYESGTLYEEPSAPPADCNPETEEC